MAYAVLSSTLQQLSTFLREESALLGGLRDEIQLIKDELGQMMGFLRKAEAMVENNPELEAWVGQLRDVAYDAEDVLDEFVLRLGRHYGDGFLGRVWKLCGSIKDLKARHQIAIKIHTIKNRIRNISEAHQRYQNQSGIFEQGSSADHLHSTLNDSRGDALLLEEADLVGIERLKKKLMNMLFTIDPKLRVICVVGMGGLGKTTLVKRVYDDATVKKRFKHHAWITSSQSFKTETLLKQVVQQLFKEVNRPAPDELDTMDIYSMKELVRDFLHQENYILVFDDIWRTTDWDAIRMAFPKNNYGCRIMITTRITEVAQAATSDIGGDVDPLDHLTKDESRTLFCNKAFGSTSCPQHLEKISEDIIDRCNGLPLAIVVIGVVLARKSRRIEEWDMFNRSIGEQLKCNNQLDNMMKLISLSYYSLPDYLRICFLYLSILPEDVTIEKTRLIWLWIAEGFVQKKEGMILEEVAEDYLNELINRNLVQVAKTTEDGRVKACRIHDIILQLVLRKAKEQDITTIFNGQGMQFPDKVRRMIIHSSDDNTQVSNGSLKYLRSLLLFESTSSMSKQFLSKLLTDSHKLLKVLELRRAPLETIPKEIFKLFHLKYLNLRYTYVHTVPKSIGNLQRLETLDLRNTNVTQLPIEILKLQQLRHLLVSQKYTGFQAPYKIGNLQYLQSLCYIDADQINDTKIVKEIGKLTQLRKLGITNLRREDGKELCSSLEKLTNLRSLRLVSSRFEEEVIDLQYSLSSTPQFLRNLELRGRLEKEPQWILSLQGLTRICLSRSRLRDDPLLLLQYLPNLVELALGKAYEGEGLCFKAGGFQELKILQMWNMPELRWVTVETGAMPLLQQLWIGECESMEDLPVGIEHLINLHYVEFFQMSDRFEKRWKDVDKKGADYHKIAHIPIVEIW